MDYKMTEAFRKLTESLSQMKDEKKKCDPVMFIQLLLQGGHILSD